MKVAIIQPSYIPWRGYFDIINSVDIFVFYDDVQYTTRDWRNRNRIKTKDGLQWLTVPVCNPHHSIINDIKIDNSIKWRDKHLRSIYHAYSSSKFFNEYFDELAEALFSEVDKLSSLDINLTHWIMRKIGINTHTICSSSLNPQGKKTERLIDMLVKLGADTYLSGPSASIYLNQDLMLRNGINVEFKKYNYDPYIQLYGDFECNVSIIDLLFNMGPKSIEFIHCNEKK